MDAEKSIDQLRAKVLRLRNECKAFRQERNLALEDKRDADIAWNELVTSLKKQAHDAAERCAEAESNLAPFSKQLDESRAKQLATEVELRATQDVLTSLYTKYCGTDDVDALNPSDREAIIRSSIEAESAAARDTTVKIQAELDRLQDELITVKAEAAVQIEANAELETRHATKLEEATKRQRELEGERDATASRCKATVEETERRLRSEIQALTLQRTEDLSTIAKMTEKLEGTERNRIAAVNRVAQLEASADEERRGIETAQAENATLRQALQKITREKERMWDRIQQLVDLAQIATEKVSASWQPDSEVTHCPNMKNCGGVEFTLFERKHHCRNCGKIFCNACTQQTILLSSSKSVERVCIECYGLIGSLKSGSFAVPTSSKDLLMAEDDE